MKKQNIPTNLIKLLKIAILIPCAAICLSSCSVTPVADDRESISFDGNMDNAGVIGFLPDGSLEITPFKRNEYNAYVQLYGTMFVPNIERDFGVQKLENGNFSMTDQAAEKFRQMKGFNKYMRSLKGQPTL